MSHRINGMNKSNLEMYLKSKGYTLKDLKAEATLIFCLNLINEYINGELTETSNYNSDYNISYEDRVVIFSSMLEIRDYLAKVVLSADKLQEILKCKDTKIDKMKARLVEPQSYFYNVIARKFHSKLNSLFDDENKYYIPEQLVIYTIVDMKEKGYGFSRFKFVDDYDFSNILEMFTRVNLLLRKTSNISIRTPIKEQTIISKMQSLSFYITEELIKSKYPKK